MSSDAFRAFQAYRQQKQRCLNPNSASYSYYGARGIRVEYEAREYIGWYLYQLEKNPGIKRPSAGRIDHSGNYTLDNLEMVEQGDNTREVNSRLGCPSSRLVKVVAVTTDGIRLHFDSVGECARVCGIRKDLLRAHLAGKIESPIPQLVFSYS